MLKGKNCYFQMFLLSQCHLAQTWDNYFLCELHWLSDSSQKEINLQFFSRSTEYHCAHNDTDKHHSTNHDSYYHSCVIRIRASQIAGYKITATSIGVVEASSKRLKPINTS